MRVREATVADAAAMGWVMVHTFLIAHRGQMPEEVWQRRNYEAMGGQVVAERDLEDGGYPLRAVVYAWPDITHLARI